MSWVPDQQTTGGDGRRLLMWWDSKSVILALHLLRTRYSTVNKTILDNLVFFLAQVCLHVWHSLSHLAHEESCSWWRRLCSRRRLHQSRSFVGGARVQCLAGEGETWRIWSVWCGQFLITFLISVTKYQTSIVLFLETVAHTETQVAIKYFSNRNPIKYFSSFRTNTR